MGCDVGRGIEGLGCRGLRVAEADLPSRSMTGFRVSRDSINRLTPFQKSFKAVEIYVIESGF